MNKDIPHKNDESSDFDITRSFKKNKRKNNDSGKGILVLALTALIVSFYSSLVGLILGIVVVTKSYRIKNESNNGMGAWVLGILSLIVSIISIVFIIYTNLK
ncbi:MAG: hypothetical protein JJE21_09645 [Spirochaetaceae bacterium]|nr:hypothetical protein [Spirochaetaceae bacterium]